MQEEVAANHVEKVKLYVDENGAVEKRALYVKRQAIPDWVIDFANQHTGPGSGEYYEVEWYAVSPNTKVYEVTRRIKGYKVEVSVGEDKVLRYVEKELPVNKVPTAVRSAVAGISGFRPTEYEEKKGPAIDIVQVEGMQNGAEVAYTFSSAGDLLSTASSLPAEIEVTR